MEALKAALKEVARLALSALVSFLGVSAVLNWIVVTISGNTIPADVQVALISALTIFVKGLDKYIHKNEDIKVKGLFPF